MPSAVTFNGNITKGVAIEGLNIDPRGMHVRDTKFWGINGVSRIEGGYGSRRIMVPVIIYDSANVDFDTAEKLADYIDTTLNTTRHGDNGTLEIHSEADHDPFLDCSFEGFELREGPKKDFAGTLGGGYFAIGIMHFIQLSN